MMLIHFALQELSKNESNMKQQFLKKCMFGREK